MTNDAKTESSVLQKTGDVKLTEDSGVTKTVLVDGSGECPADGMEIKVHYVGTLIDGTKFDSSRDREEPFSFKLGNGSVIKGWDICVKTMKVGEKCLLFCTAPYAYGKKGSGEKIPPDATLKFELELLSYDYESVTEDKTVRKKIISNGKRFERTKEGDVCDVLITGWVRGEKDNPFIPLVEKKFIIGDENDPPAIDSILCDMEKAEKSIYFVYPGKHHFAKGKEPAGVRQEDVLEFEIELKKITKQKEIWDMSREEKIEEAGSMKAAGNTMFKAGRKSIALNRYKRAIACLENLPELSEIQGESVEEPENEEEGVLTEEQKSKARAIFLDSLNNSALVLYHLGNYSGAIEKAERALKVDAENTKALFRLAMALKCLGRYEEALESMEKLRKVDAENPLFKRSFGEIKRRKLAEKNEISLMMKAMASGLGKK